MEKKRSKRRWILSGVFVFFVIAIGGLMMLASLDEQDRAEDNRRRGIALAIKKQAEDHYRQFKEYPPNKLTPPGVKAFGTILLFC
jgi:hypothetical protein